MYLFAYIQEAYKLKKFGNFSQDKNCQKVVEKYTVHGFMAANTLIHICTSTKITSNQDLSSRTSQLVLR